MKFIKVLTLIILLLSTGCSSNKTQTIPQTSPSQKQINLPWYLAQTPPNDASYVYGVGSGESLDKSMSSAKESIASYYRSYIENELNYYKESIEVNQRESFAEYYSQQMKLLSNLNIPGITHVQTDQVDKVYYSLVKSERALFDSNQEIIKDEIINALKLGDSHTNPGLKLQSYYLAASLLSKLISPLEYQGKLAFVYISEQISSLFSEVEINYTFQNNSEYSNFRGLTISIKSGNETLTGIPLVMGGESYYPDKQGNYYLENYSSDPFNLIIRVDVDKINLSPQLQGRELGDAKKLIKLLTSFEQTLHIVPPVTISAFVKVSHFINNEQASNSQLVNKIKEVLLAKKISLTSNKAEANLVISATSNCDESSHNQYLGYVYKGWGFINLEKSGNERIVIDLSDEETREKTKSFAKEAKNAANSAKDKLNNLLIDKLKSENLK